MGDKDKCFPCTTLKRNIGHSTPYGLESSQKKQRLLSTKQTELQCSESVNIFNISEGILLLGLITEVKDKGLTIALPGCVVGTIPAINISTSYTEAMGCSSYTQTFRNPVTSLQLMFKVGEIYPCKVVSVKSSPGSVKKYVTLSINPNDVNSDLRKASLYAGMVLHVAVESVEDSGYVMDTGIQGLLGFVKFSDLVGTSKMKIGQVMAVRVQKFEPSTLNFIPLAPFLKTQKIVGNVPLISILPGMLVNALVNQSTNKGISLTCMGYEAFIHRDHIPPNIEIGKIISTEITATVLYVHPISQVMYLTLIVSEHLDKRNKILHFFEKYDYIEHAVVKAVNKKNIVFGLGFTAYKGIALKIPESQSSDHSEYIVGSTMRCRVISVHPLDNIVKVSIRPSYLNIKVLAKKELVTGAILEGKIKEYVKDGLLMTLSRSASGFVPGIHFPYGPVTHVGNLCKIGTEVQCRILSVDYSGTPSIFLTCRKQLCDPKLLVLSAYEIAYLGMVTMGVVVDVKPNYILLHFFNNIQGMVPQSDTYHSNLEESYYKGQIVKCRVTFCKPEQKILHLSLKDLQPKKRLLNSEQKEFQCSQGLNILNISEGMLLLGIITEVRNKSLAIALPGCLVGTVPAMNISTPYTNLLKDFKPVTSLQSMFNVGQIYPCKVIKTSPGPMKKSVTLSINPIDVNSNLRKSSLYAGMMLHVAVESVEDGGYVVDTGIPGVIGFLKFSHLVCNSKRNIGQVMPVLVGQFAPSTSKIVPLAPRLTIHFFNYNVTKIVGNFPFDSFFPGMLVEALVNQSTNEGISLTCMGYEAFMHRDHIPPNIEIRKIISTEITATVLYVHPVSHIIHLTLIGEEYLCKGRNVLYFVEKYDFVENAVVKSIDNKNIIFSFRNPAYKGIASKIPESPNSSHSEYSVGSTMRCRVVSVHPLDNIIKLSIKPSYLNIKVLSKEELIIGKILYGKIKKYVKNGLWITLSPNISGFVPNIHFPYGPVVNIRKRCKIGSEIECRILSVNCSITPYSISLTCKKTLCHPKLLLLSTYKSAYVGMTTKGVIVDVKPNYMLLDFFNDVQGMVPQSATDHSNLEKSYFKGQVVKCRVTFCKPEERILHLSLKDFQTDTVAVKSNIHLGQVLDVRIQSKEDEGFQVQIVNTLDFAFLPFGHLTDHKEHVEEFSELYLPGDTLKVLVFGTQPSAIVTSKYSFLQAAVENLLVNSVSDYCVGKVVPAVMTGSDCKKIIFELGSNIIGRISEEKQYRTLKFEVLENKTRMAKICSIDTEDNEVTLCIRPSEVYDQDTNYGLEALVNYLDDRERMKTLYQRKAGTVKNLSHFVVGTIVIATISKITENSVYCTLKDHVTGHASVLNVDEKLKEGEQYSAVVLFVDFASQTIEVSFSKNLTKGKRSSSLLPKFHYGHGINSKVVFVANQFIIAALEGDLLGAIVFLPTRKILNDFQCQSNLFSVGQFHRVIVKGQYMGNFLAVLEMHYRLYEQTVLLSKNSSSGSVVNVCENLITLDDSDKSNITVNIEDLDIASEKEINYGNDKLISIIDKDSSKLPVGHVVKAKILNIQKMQVNVCVNEHLKGRIHITNVGCENEGQFPLEGFHCDRELNAVIVGYHKKLVHSYLPLSHHKFISYAECKLENATCPDGSKKLVPGDIVLGFVEKVNDEGLSLSLNLNQSAELPYLNIGKTLTELCSIRKQYKLGQSVSGSVLFLKSNPVLSKLGHWSPVQGTIVVGIVELTSPGVEFNVKLPNGYSGELSITDIADNYNIISHMMLNFLHKKFIQCFVLKVDQKLKHCQVSTRLSRIYGYDFIVDPEITFSNLVNGQTLRGFVTDITSSNVHVNIGHKLEGFIELTVENRDSVKKCQIASIVAVKIMSIKPKLTFSLVEVQDHKIGLALGSVMAANMGFD